MGLVREAGRGASDYGCSAKVAWMIGVRREEDCSDAPGKDGDMRYRLWDTDIGQLFGAFETEQEALSVVRILVANYGDDIIDDLGLAQELPDGSPGTPLNGRELVRRASEVAAGDEIDAADRARRDTVIP